MRRNSRHFQLRNIDTELGAAIGEKGGLRLIDGPRSCWPTAVASLAYRREGRL